MVARRGLVATVTPSETMTRAIEINQVLGALRIILASAHLDTQGLKGWKRLSGQPAAASGQVEPLGLFAGYHTHWAEWIPLERGARVTDVIAATTPPSFVG